MLSPVAHAKEEDSMKISFPLYFSELALSYASCNKYFVILDHSSNKIDLCCDITLWTVCANDWIQGFALYTGTLPIFKCRYATNKFHLTENYSITTCIAQG